MMHHKQVNFKLSEAQFDKLDTLCMQQSITKQEFCLRAVKTMFLLMKGKYFIVDKDGNKVEIV